MTTPTAAACMCCQRPVTAGEAHYLSRYNDRAICLGCDARGSGAAAFDVVYVPATPATHDPAERAREKQAARDQDAADLASGVKSCEQLHTENAALAGLRVRVDFAGAKRLA